MWEREMGETKSVLDRAQVSWGEGKALIRRLQARCLELENQVQAANAELQHVRAESQEKQKVIDETLLNRSHDIDFANKFEAERQRSTDLVQDLRRKITSCEATIHELGLQDKFAKSEISSLTTSKYAVERKLDVMSQQLAFVSKAFSDYKDR